MVANTNNWALNLEQGHLGEHETASMLRQRGWKVKMLMDDIETCTLPYDLIIEKNGETRKIEVKSSTGPRVNDSFCLELLGKKSPEADNPTGRVQGWFMKDLIDAENNGINHPDFYIFHRLRSQDWYMIKAIDLYSYFRTNESFIWNHTKEDMTGILHFCNWETYNKPENRNWFQQITADINGF